MPALINPEGLNQFREFLFNILAQKEQQSVVKWVEENTTIPTGAMPGRTSLNMIPYCREILERFGSKDTRHIVLCFSTQAAKTTCLMLGMLYRLCCDPADAMWVFPNEKLAKSTSKSRWRKFVMECPLALDLVPRTSGGSIDKNLFGYLEQLFRTMTLRFAGAGSPANISSYPSGIMLMDETDKYDDEGRYEAAAIQLAEERTKSYPFPLIVKASTPTLANRMIWTEFNKTDMRYYWVPCPRCGEYIRLHFTVKSEEHGDCGLRWWREDPSESKTDGVWDMKKVVLNAFYKCQTCGGDIYDHEKPDMIDVGEWRPTNPGAPTGRHGYQLSSLYSIVGTQTTFNQIAVQWLVGYNLPSERRNFINSWLAEVWDDERSVDFKDLVFEQYATSDVPKDSEVVMVADAQENHFWVVIRRFARPSKEFPNGQSWLIVADRIEEESQLVALQKEHNVPPENVVVDMRHNPNQIARMIIEHGWRGMMGVDKPLVFDHPQPNGTKTERIYSTVKYRDPYLGTAWANRTIERARYVKFNKEKALDMLSALRYHQPTIWHIHANAHERYTRQINSRVKRQKQNPRTGKTEWYYHELHTEDHLGDCEAMAIVRALQLGMIYMVDEVVV